MRLIRERLLILAMLCTCLPALSQTTTARLQGVVRDAQGPLPGVTVAAVNTESGLRRATITGTDGAYELVVPPGPYNVTAGTPAHQEQTQAIRVQVGQTFQQNFELQPGKMVAQSVSVSAELEPEVHSTEVATNVSKQQIENLPQNTRNFLNFVVLAPGARTSHDELRQEISYGAQGSTNTNVFIDGTSFKNDVTQGGSVGQDASRGNPFPQNAVQEFRVITQNYKAEYQKASSVIISAVTKSGTNELHGDAFFYYQNKNLVAQDKFTQAQGLDKPEYTRYQPGLSLGGPISKDKLFFFLSYEGNYQNREKSVLLGTDSTWPQAFRNSFQSYVGNFPSDFRASLAFGKLSAILAEGSTLDFSGDWRHETDIRDFGDQTSNQSATNVKNDVGSARLKHTGIFGKLLNEATLGYQKFRWNPVPEDTSLVGQNYFGLMRIGSKETIQDISQSRYSFRDDLTVTSLQAAGDHVIKTGITFDYLKYHVVKQQNGIPVFNFRTNPGSFISTPGDMPFEAFYGFGNPDLSTNNKQFGVYVQDDWRITPRLVANIGLRWDFETDMLNNDYVTPANVRAGLSSVYPSNYFTDGSQRDTYYGAIQPRIGLTYDLTGQGKTIAYAGYGKYYDRTLYNDILDEKFRLQWPTYHFFFSPDGGPQDGNPAIKWDPSYLSQNGLDNLIARGTAPPPEIYLLDNNTKPPSSDQWSAGLRHNFGAFSAAVGYMNVKSKNQLTWTCGIKDANGNCDFGARPAASQGLGFSLLSRGKESWYESIQVQLDKPYSSNWAATFSYVYGDAKQTGNDLFSFGNHDPAYGIKQRSPNVQKHTITASAVVGLPLDFRFGTLITLGSGFPFFVNDCSAGGPCVENIGGGDPPKWTESVDLRLEKSFIFGGSYSVSLNVQVINLFNYSNEQGYDGFIATLPNVNTNFGHPNSAYNPRRVEFGARFSF